MVPLRDWVRSGDAMPSSHCSFDNYTLLHTTVGGPGPVARQLLGSYSYVSLGIETFIHVGESRHTTRCMPRLRRHDPFRDAWDLAPKVIHGDLRVDDVAKAQKEVQ